MYPQVPRKPQIVRFGFIYPVSTLRGPKWLWHTIPPKDYRERPVVVLGATVLERRVACIWASAGYNRADCIAYVKQHVTSYAEHTGATPGETTPFDDSVQAIGNAWLIIEAVPEKIQLKIDTFAQLDKLAPNDCILASNSSSYRSSEMLENVSDETKRRILNMHYYMPPRVMIVELMTDGFTEPSILQFMAERSKEAGTKPYTARKESTGFIFNRLESDSIWTDMLLNGSVLPCKGMIVCVGLDTVASIEKHYITERGLSADKTIEFLQTNYLDQGKLGTRCPKGGLYPPTEIAKHDTGSSLLALDIGLSLKEPGSNAGEIFQVSRDGHVQKVLATGQALPDGIARVYFCDREGLRVIRCNYDGSKFEVLVQAGDPNDPVDSHHARNWCVGITVAAGLDKFYWSQKGPSKGGQGRIFSANINTPQGQSVSTRDDVRVTLTRLPAPIDLEIDEHTRTLYWTDRGELPFGNSLNRLCLDHFSLPLPSTSRLGYEVLNRNLNEAIGLKLDLPNNSIYLIDLDGDLYRCNRDGKYRVKLLSHENRALGIIFRTRKDFAGELSTGIELQAVYASDVC
ncbi:hypothetical protein BJX99DRAFT_246766 [Aspergillus californicus]